jgi:flagellar protein FliS
MPAPSQSGHAITSYQRQDVLSETPLELIARLYDMARLETARAQAALAKRQWGAKGMAVHRAGGCLSLLQCSLNLDSGGEVAKNLDRLYTYMMRRLSEAHLANDATIFQEIVDHLTELGAAWREAARKQQSPAAAPEPEAKQPAAQVAAR